MNPSTHPLRCLLLGGATLVLTGCGGKQASVLMTDDPTITSRSSCSAPPEASQYPLLGCSSVANGSAPLVDDFEDGNLVLPVRPAHEGRVGSWYLFTDETDGCATMQVEQGDSSPALHFTGDGFSAWGAGFGFSLAWSFEQGGLCTYDLSGYKALRFRARGNTQLRMNVASRATTPESTGGNCPSSSGQSCFDHHGRNLALSPELEDWEVPFCSLAQKGDGTALGPLDRTQMTNVNFLVPSARGFDVWLDDIELVPWPEGQSRDCGSICPMEQLTLGITPQPDRTAIDQEMTGVRLFTFQQPTSNCPPLPRRYLSYIPKSLGPASNAPVLIVLHGLGADAESMRSFITQARFETLAERDKFIVVYGNAAPGTGTVSERPNGGGFRKDLTGQDPVDDFAYLQLIIEDLTARGAIDGSNPVFLTGLSDGGGLTHLAALHAPTRYRGIAAIMPYPGKTVAMPERSGAFSLQRVLLAYSVTDPGMAAGYAGRLTPLGPAWATALGLSGDMPQTTRLANLVDEGVGYAGTEPKILNTLASQAEQIDYGKDPAGAQVRVLKFDRAGHLWPVRTPPDGEQEKASFGLRNQDVDMSDVVWEFFKSSL